MMKIVLKPTTDPAEATKQASIDAAKAEIQKRIDAGDEEVTAEEIRTALSKTADELPIGHIHQAALDLDLEAQHLDE